MVVDLDYLGDDIVDRAREYIEMVDLELMGLTLKNGTRQETFNMVASLQLKNAMNTLNYNIKKSNKITNIHSFVMIIFTAILIALTLVIVWKGL
tara:strand:+ start:63 stop:344 length:282 start_codon:yes stop_codon:yes gene_type:complete